MSKFISHFADYLETMLSYREALGFSRYSHEPHLLNFDRYAVTNYPNSLLLEKNIVISWLDELMEKGVQTLNAKASAIRLFGKYLTSIGQMAYILPDEYVSQPPNFTPYIFTDDELSRLFYAADRLSKGFIDVTASKTMPVLLRLIYTCGLRPNEARELLYQNVNFEAGEIFVTKTKRKKERLIVMSDDMLGFMKRYDAIRNTFAADSAYTFPRKDGAVYTTSQLERLFKKCWSNANPSIPAETLPNVRVYDLRHRFASAVLNKWLDERQNLYNKLPYLRAYMGHDRMSETAYYIHILPENLVKNAGIDWTAFEDLIPEVTVWQA